MSRTCIENVTKELQDIGVQYVGICCGNRAAYIRTMAETLGRKPPASKYSPDMSQHFSQIAGDATEFTNKKWNATYADTKNCVEGLYSGP